MPATLPVRLPCVKDTAPLALDKVIVPDIPADICPLLPDCETIKLPAPALEIFTAPVPLSSPSLVKLTVLTVSVVPVAETVPALLIELPVKVVELALTLAPLLTANVELPPAVTAAELVPPVN